MRPGRLRFDLELTLGVALLASLGVILYLSWRLTTVQRQRAGVERALSQLEEAVRRRGLQQAPAEIESAPPTADYPGVLARRDATIEALNHQLSEAQASVMGLQAQLSSATEERQKALADVNQQQEKARADWQSQLDALKQELDSAQAEVQGSRQRAAALEAENAKLKNDSSAATARGADFTRTVGQLQDLNGRRDALLTSILHRYREITSQFRAMGGMLGSNRDSNAGPLTDTTLTRIQSAVSSADDDLRQLSELNAQESQLEKKLTKK
jgi:chromosome segregation ATPase